MQIRRALIVGGGIAGLACAIRLRRAGVEIDLVERDPHWLDRGAGIAFTALSLRALKALGVLDELCEQGASGDTLRFYTSAGDLIVAMTPPPIESGVPNSAAIMRSRLAAILSSRTRASGVHPRPGVVVESFSDGPDEIEARFSDGCANVYDLVIGADGLHSQMRAELFPSGPLPKLTGQGCWRIVAERPRDVQGIEAHMSGDAIVSLFPVSASHLYMSVITTAVSSSRVTNAEHIIVVRDTLASFGGHVRVVRDSLEPNSPLVYRPLETILSPAPWHKGRVVLVGDAVHGATPHVAAGGGMAVEDALVLGEELERAPDLHSALTAYAARRFDRCALVVNTGLRVGASQMDGSAGPEQGQLMGMAVAKLAERY